MIDTHFHVWHRADAAHAGILATHYLQRDFTWDDFCGAWDGLPVERCVEVQVKRLSPPEARFGGEIAERDRRLGATWAGRTCESPRAAADLEALLAFPLVRGIHRTLQFETDPRFAITEGYIHGAPLLGERGLVCELCVWHEQIESMPGLVRACPIRNSSSSTSKPDLSRQPTAGWLRRLRSCASLPTWPGSSRSSSTATVTRPPPDRGGGAL